MAFRRRRTHLFATGRKGKIPKVSRLLQVEGHAVAAELVLQPGPATRRPRSSAFAPRANPVIAFSTGPPHTLWTPSQGEGRYPMEHADSRSEISIHRYSNGSACDVIVAIGDREMVVRLPD